MFCIDSNVMKDMKSVYSDIVHKDSEIFSSLTVFYSLAFVLFLKVILIKINLAFLIFYLLFKNTVSLFKTNFSEIHLLSHFIKKFFFLNASFTW